MHEGSEVSFGAFTRNTSWFEGQDSDAGPPSGHGPATAQDTSGDMGFKLPEVLW